MAGIPQPECNDLESPRAVVHIIYKKASLRQVYAQEYSLGTAVSLEVNGLLETCFFQKVFYANEWL